MVSGLVGCGVSILVYKLKNREYEFTIRDKSNRVEGKLRLEESGTRVNIKDREKLVLTGTRNKSDLEFKEIEPAPKGMASALTFTLTKDNYAKGKVVVTTNAQVTETHRMALNRVGN